MLRDGPRYFLMQRTRAGGDARLHDRYSIGVGGHLNPGDADLDGGLRREWAEELVADFVPGVPSSSRCSTTTRPRSGPSISAPCTSPTPRVARSRSARPTSCRALRRPAAVAAVADRTRDLEPRSSSSSSRPGSPRPPRSGADRDPAGPRRRCDRRRCRRSPCGSSPSVPRAGCWTRRGSARTKAALGPALDALGGEVVRIRSRDGLRLSARWLPSEPDDGRRRLAPRPARGDPAAPRVHRARACPTSSSTGPFLRRPPASSGSTSAATASPTRPRPRSACARSRTSPGRWPGSGRAGSRSVALVGTSMGGITAIASVAVLGDGTLAGADADPMPRPARVRRRPAADRRGRRRLGRDRSRRARSRRACPGPRRRSSPSACFDARGSHARWRPTRHRSDQGHRPRGSGPAPAHPRRGGRDRPDRRRSSTGRRGRPVDDRTGSSRAPITAAAHATSPASYESRVTTFLRDAFAGVRAAAPIIGAPGPAHGLRRPTRRAPWRTDGQDPHRRRRPERPATPAVHAQAGGLRRRRRRGRRRGIPPVGRRVARPDPARRHAAQARRLPGRRQDPGRGGDDRPRPDHHAHRRARGRAEGPRPAGRRRRLPHQAVPPGRAAGPDQEPAGPVRPEGRPARPAAARSRRSRSTAPRAASARRRSPSTRRSRSTASSGARSASSTATSSSATTGSSSTSASTARASSTSSPRRRSTRTSSARSWSSTTRASTSCSRRRRPRPPSSSRPEHLPVILEHLRGDVRLRRSSTSTSGIDDVNLGIIEAADTVFVVMTADLSCLKNVRLVLETISHLGYEPEKVQLVLNRSNAFTGINVQNAEGALKRTIEHQVVNEYRGAISALNSGAPFMFTKADSAARRVAAPVRPRPWTSRSPRQTATARVRSPRRLAGDLPRARERALRSPARCTLSEAQRTPRRTALELVETRRQPVGERRRRTRRRPRSCRRPSTAGAGIRWTDPVAAEQRRTPRAEGHDDPGPGPRRRTRRSRRPWRRSRRRPAGRTRARSG